MLYIPNDYGKQLDSMKLSEIVPLPHFTEPFVSIAQDQQHQQYAVLFYSEDPVKIVKLPVTYEDIVKELESDGATIERPSYPQFTNFNMIEYKDQLFWNYDDGKLRIYMNLNGKRAYPYQN